MVKSNKKINSLDSVSYFNNTINMPITDAIAAKTAAIKVGYIHLKVLTALPTLSDKVTRASVKSVIDIVSIVHK